MKIWRTTCSNLSSNHSVFFSLNANLSLREFLFVINVMYLPRPCTTWWDSRRTGLLHLLFFLAVQWTQWMPPIPLVASRQNPFSGQAMQRSWEMSIQSRIGWAWPNRQTPQNYQTTVVSWMQWTAAEYVSITTAVVLAASVFMHRLTDVALRDLPFQPGFMMKHTAFTTIAIPPTVTVSAIVTILFWWYAAWLRRDLLLVGESHVSTRTYYVP